MWLYNSKSEGMLRIGTNPAARLCFVLGKKSGKRNNNKRFHASRHSPIAILKIMGGVPATLVHLGNLRMRKQNAGGWLLLKFTLSDRAFADDAQFVWI